MVKRIANIIAFSLILTACLDARPTLPNFDRPYRGDEAVGVEPGPSSEETPGKLDPETTEQVDPGSAEQNESENEGNESIPAAPLPTSEEIQAAPVQAGIALYSHYCSECHGSYDSSLKRGARGTTSLDVLHGYTRNFPPHQGADDWPKTEEQGFALESALAVPIGRDVAEFVFQALE